MSVSNIKMLNEKVQSDKSVNFDIADYFIGSSAKTRSLLSMARSVAKSDATLLILGPTGAGKDVLAKAIHSVSQKRGEFIAINCAAIPSELLESELFGYEKGAFTGADKLRIGLFEMANGGTLFLDEIGDMPLHLQTKLLRVLEEKKFRRVGGREDVQADFRVICATHRNVQTLVSEGKFREDLSYRIGVFQLEIPPLKERTCDIRDLVDHFITEFLGPDQIDLAPHFHMDAMRVLLNYDWPGNVRQLRNVVERATVFFPGKMIHAQNVEDSLIGNMVPHYFNDLSSVETPHHDYVISSEISLPHPASFYNSLEPDQKIDLRGYLRDIEAALIETCIGNVQGNVSKAADYLGLQRTTLIEKMRKLGIERQ